MLPFSRLLHDPSLLEPLQVLARQEYARTHTHAHVYTRPPMSTLLFHSFSLCRPIFKNPQHEDDGGVGGVSKEGGKDYDNRKGRIGGGKPPTAAASKKTTIETDGVEDEVGSDSGEYRKKGQRGNVETAFASFEDYQHILDAWDPDNPDAPLPAGISVPNQKISSSSKKGLGSGRGRGSVRGKGRNGNVGESSGGTGKKRQRRR